LSVIIIITIIIMIMIIINHHHNHHHHDDDHDHHHHDHHNRDHHFFVCCQVCWFRVPLGVLGFSNVAVTIFCVGFDPKPKTVNQLVESKTWETLL